MLPERAMMLEAVGERAPAAAEATERVGVWGVSSKPVEYGTKSWVKPGMGVKFCPTKDSGISGRVPMEYERARVRVWVRSPLSYLILA